MDDLWGLEGCSTQAEATNLPATITHVTTPLQLASWAYHLAGHPDRAFIAYILQGIKEGFRIGFDRRYNCRSAIRNLKSVQEHPHVVDAYIQHEVSLGRVTPLRSEVTPPLVGLISSPIGVIPKRNRQSKWRLIVDLSSPKGSSVNDGMTCQSLLTDLCIRRSCSRDATYPRQGSSTGQAQSKGRIPSGTSPPTRPPFIGNAMEGRNFY